MKILIYPSRDTSPHILKNIIYLIPKYMRREITFVFYRWVNLRNPTRNLSFFGYLPKFRNLHGAPISVFRLNGLALADEPKSPKLVTVFGSEPKAPEHLSRHLLGESTGKPAPFQEVDDNFHPGHLSLLS